jgi:hypothetical protein
LSILHQTR